MKLIEERVKSGEFTEIQSQIKTEDELSDFMLDGVVIDKIEAKLFDILYRDGLEDMNEDHLIKYTGFNKKQAKKYLDEHYIKSSDYYYLKALKTERIIVNLVLLPGSKNDIELENSVREGLKVTTKIKKTMNRLQRVIRGTIYYSSVFEAKSLNNEFISVFGNVLKIFDIDHSYIIDINNNAEDLLLCIMTLLHDSTFEFYDKNTAKIYLCSYLDYDPLNPFRESPFEIYNGGVLALYINYNSNNSSNSYPLFVSDLKIKNYVSAEDFNEFPTARSTERIPWISAARINNSLKLINV